MKVRTASLALLVALMATTASADFNQVVRAIGRTSGVRRVHMPIFGLARLFTRIVRPDGISDVRLALFERGSGGAHDIAAAVEGAMGSDWSLTANVQESSGETAAVYMRPVRDGLFDLLVVASEASGEITVVQTRLTEEAMNDMADDHWRR